MGVVSIRGALDLEAKAFENGWTGESLLDSAGEALGHSVGRHFPHPGTAVGYLGKGHNAGDALVALKILRDSYGWHIATRHAFSLDAFGPVPLAKWHQLGLTSPSAEIPRPHLLKRPLLLLDGLLGTGASGALRAPLRGLAREMTDLRRSHAARIAAVDLPSGINADTGEILPDTVTADITFMIGTAKRGLLHSQAAEATGALALVPVPPLNAPPADDLELISPQILSSGKPPRPFSFHKGMAGRIAIVAGSDAYTGAAVLVATGALRGGAGLITLHVPDSIRAIISGKCPPEIIVDGYLDAREVLETRFDALIVGCGLGKPDDQAAEEILTLIENNGVPTVLDADALNLLAARNRTDILLPHHVLTPHPGEFARLAPDLAELPREQAARQFADRIPAVLLLKGSRTLVTRRGQPLHANSTGTPGMATGGQGDLLSGVIGALLATGEDPMMAAARGAWLCGRAAEIALDQSHLSEESLTPEDVLHFLGTAFTDWRQATR
jgi:ADP-dependent NAD(P)H-hydrate dehydratase / NAD(P)H-hydrate epimerase